MLYELKEAAITGDVFYINTRAVTSISCQRGPQQGLVTALITLAGGALRSMHIEEEDFKAFLEEVQKTV